MKQSARPSIPPGSCYDAFSSSTREEADMYVGLYPARTYLFLVEFAGPRIKSITLTEQHVRTLDEHLPKLSDANNTFARTTFFDYRRLQSTWLPECTAANNSSDLSWMNCVM
jgi:hypothetical protein